MAQNSVNYGNNPTGPELLNDYLDKEQENILTSNSGIQRPSYADVGTKWLDISSTPWALKIFDGTSDVIIGTVNPTTHAFISAGIDTAVLLTGNQTIGGTKTFTVTPQVPTASSGDSSSNVANTAFVTSADANLQTQISSKANLSDVVTLTGAQTISGAKTFTGVTMLPAGTTISKQDNDLEGGEIKFQRANNDPLLQDPSLDLYNGVMRFLYCNAVQVPATDFNNCAVNTVSKSKSANGFFKLGNGLIIQWSWHSGSGSTLTFPTPFTSTNYSVTANYRKQSSSGSGIGHVNFYPTSTTSCYFNSQGGDFQWIAIGY